MSKINLHNYEAWLLDYQEGNLSDEQANILMAFLAAHPEIEIDLEGFDELKLSPENDAFQGKFSLYQIPDQIKEEFDSLSVLIIDGEISADEQMRLNEIMSEFPMLENELSTWKKTQLQPEEIRFGEHQSLKKVAQELTEFELLALHHIEGLATIEQENKLQVELKTDPKHAQIFTALFKSKLKADMEITFADKALLKKHIPFFTAYRQPLRYIVSVAAVVVFILAVIPFMPINEQSQSSAMALVNQNKPLNTARKTAKKTELMSENEVSSPLEKISIQEAVLQDESINNQSTAGEQLASLPLIGISEIHTETQNISTIAHPLTYSDELAIMPNAEGGIFDPVNELLRLRNLALRQINRITELPEQINIKREDIAQGAEKITNGNVRINAEKDESKQNYGFSIGSFSYERIKGNR
ncbi:MAG: hypothetical protein ACK4GL_07330 [Flavobacteriales bacterium]